jgi:hypothetical protein
MAEQQLDGPQIGSRLDQVRGKAMAQRVGRDVLAELGAMSGG